jgi:hypothetical protein
MWSLLLACAAGPFNTGQEILTYLYFNFLLIFIIILLHLTYPTNFMAKVITKSTPWGFRGRPRAIRHTRVKRYKIPVRKLQIKSKKHLRGAAMRTYLFPALFTAFKVGCHVEVFL